MTRSMTYRPMSQVSMLSHVFRPSLHILGKRKKRGRELSWDNDNDKEVLLQQEAKRSLMSSSSATSISSFKPKEKQENESLKAFKKRIRQETKQVWHTVDKSSLPNELRYYLMRWEANQSLLRNEKSTPILFNVFILISIRFLKAKKLKKKLKTASQNELVIEDGQSIHWHSLL